MKMELRDGVNVFSYAGYVLIEYKFEQGVVRDGFDIRCGSDLAEFKEAVCLTIDSMIAAVEKAKPKG